MMNYEEDLIYKGILCGLDTFLEDDNIEHLQNYINDFRERKLNKDDESLDIEEINDEEDEQDTYLEKDRSCNCNFCQKFNN